MKLSDLLKLPSVVQLFNSNTGILGLSDAQQDELAGSFPGVLLAHHRKMRTDLLHKLRQARAAVKTEVLVERHEPDSPITSMLSRWMDGGTTLLFRASSVFFCTCEPRIWHSYMTFVRRQRELSLDQNAAPWSEVSKTWIFKPAVIKLACFLVASLNFPSNVTMGNLRSRGKAFVCLRCPVENRKPLDG